MNRVRSPLTMALPLLLLLSIGVETGPASSLPPSHSPSIREDLDGDGILESIGFIGSDASLSLKWSGTHQGLVELAATPATPENVLEEPALRLLPTIGSDPVRFLASVVWKTNGIGSTAQLQLFEWRDGQPQGVWNNQEAIQQVSYRMSHYEAESAWMEVPFYHYKDRVPVSKRIYDSLAEGTVEERAVTAYGIQDFDQDGHLELAMVKAIRTGAVPLLPFGLVLEFYSLDSDPPIKRMTIPLPPAVVPYVETGLATGDFSDLTTGPTSVQEWAKQHLIEARGEGVSWNLSSK